MYWWEVRFSVNGRLLQFLWTFFLFIRFFFRSIAHEFLPKHFSVYVFVKNLFNYGYFFKLHFSGKNLNVSTFEGHFTTCEVGIWPKSMRLSSFEPFEHFRVNLVNFWVLVLKEVIEQEVGGRIWVLMLPRVEESTRSL